MSLSTLRVAAALAVLAVTTVAAGATIDLFLRCPTRFPTGSTWNLVGTFDTPFGWVRVTTVSDFTLLSAIITPEGFEATYSADLSQTAYTMETGGMSLGANLLTSDDFEVLIGGGF